MGQGHPCACRLLTDHPHGSWSQVSPQLGRRPGRGLSAPHPHSSRRLGVASCGSLDPAGPASLGAPGGGQLWQVVTRRALAH